jgi:hypothetical protein
MMRLHEHILLISKAINTWLRPDNTELKLAIERSIDESLFAEHDIRHRIRHLKQSVNHNSLVTWCTRAGLITPSLQGKKVCCLHAGNIPLVGFHDLLGVLLSGAEYYGKLSRKDPYLMESFLNVLKGFNLVESNHWTTQIDRFNSLQADAILFSGSPASVGPVRKKLSMLGISQKSTPELIRTAHFSIAWITDHSKETMEDVTEAVFRYSGNGCRSVAIIVAPFSLHHEKCSFTDYIESFWLKNPQHQKPAGALYYRYAYNNAVGIEQAWLEDFLIEETSGPPDEKFVLHWVEGGEEELKNILMEIDGQLQSVYSNSMAGKKISGRVIEPLSLAQTPPVWWKADNTDTIEWLLKSLSE